MAAANRSSSFMAIGPPAIQRNPPRKSAVVAAGFGCLGYSIGSDGNRDRSSPPVSRWPDRRGKIANCKMTIADLQFLLRDLHLLQWLEQIPNARRGSFS